MDNMLLVLALSLEDNTNTSMLKKWFKDIQLTDIQSGSCDRYIFY